MALRPTELQEEAVVQLSLLAQSPGWGLYKARLRSLSRSKEVEKAAFLRRAESTGSIYAQGYVDGLQMALEELERYVERLQQGVASLPPEGSG